MFVLGDSSRPVLRMTSLYPYAFDQHTLAFAHRKPDICVTQCKPSKSEKKTPPNYPPEESETRHCASGVVCTQAPYACYLPRDQPLCAWIWRCADVLLVALIEAFLLTSGQ